MSATPSVGHVISRDHGIESSTGRVMGSAFYTIIDLRPTLDGDLVVADLDAEAAKHHGHSQIQVKASDLRPAGAIAGVTVWTY